MTVASYGESADWDLLFLLIGVLLPIIVLMYIFWQLLF